METSHSEWAIALAQGYADTIPIGEPLAMCSTPVVEAAMTPSKAWSAEQAYTVQKIVFEAVSAQWASPAAGFKISITNADDQRLVNATEPVMGRFTANQILASGAILALAHSNQPLIEPELVMRALEPLTPDMDENKLADLVEITAGLEIPMSRIGNWWPAGQPPRISLADLIGDNAAAGVVVHGDRWATHTVEDIAAVTVKITTPKTIVEGSAARVLGNPLTALRWLTAKLVDQGEGIEAGTIISSGTFTAPQRASVGNFSAEFSHGVGGVAAYFV